MPSGSSFDVVPSGGERTHVENDFIEVVTQDGTTGWLPLAAGISVYCARR